MTICLRLFSFEEYAYPEGIIWYEIRLERVGHVYQQKLFGSDQFRFFLYSIWIKLCHVAYNTRARWCMYYIYIYIYIYIYRYIYIYIYRPIIKKVYNMSSPLLDWTVGMFLLSYMACIEYNDQTCPRCPGRTWKIIHRNSSDKIWLIMFSKESYIPLPAGVSDSWDHCLLIYIS